MYPGRGDPRRGGGYSNRPRGGRGGYSSRGGRERSDFDGRNYAYGNDAGGGYGGNSGGGGFDGSGGGGGYDRSSSGPVFGGSSRGGYGGNPASPAFGGNVGRGGFGGSSGGFGGGGFGRSSGGGGFGGSSSGGFQLAGSPPNDTTQWPPSDGGSGSGGFGTLIDDSSIFLNPRPPREAPTPVHPFGGVIPEGRHDYTSPRGRGRGGYGRHQPGDRRNSDNNRRNGMAPTPPVAEEKVDPERVALVEKFKELMNDDGGVYTSDEEEKTPRKDDKEPTPRKDDKEPSPKEDDKKAVEPTPAEPSYDAAPIPDAPIRQQMNSGPSRRGRGSHNHSFRPKPVSKPSPLPAPEPAMEPEEDADAKDEKFADSILLTLLSDQGMRETLKKHDPELFDLMVKHIAVVALKQA